MTTHRPHAPAPVAGPPHPPMVGLDEEEPAEDWRPRAGRRTFRAKLGAGCRGMKHAFRGDSSFFAHAYRGTMIALSAAMLGVGPTAWCLLTMSAALVFVAELAHSAVDALARTLGDPEAPGLVAAGEIATAGVFVAVTSFAAVSIAVLTIKVGEMLGWWS